MVDLCGAELFSILRNITFVVAVLCVVGVLFFQNSLMADYIEKNEVLFNRIIGDSRLGYDNDVMGVYGFFIMWRFNRELRKDKQTLDACRGAYNVYLSLIAGFVLSAVFLVVSFSLC